MKLHSTIFQWCKDILRERTKLHSRQNGGKARGKLLVIKMGKIKSKEVLQSKIIFLCGPFQQSSNIKTLKEKSKKTVSYLFACQENTLNYQLGWLSFL